MTAIDIGPGAIDRSTYAGGNYTYVDKNNPANDTGKIAAAEFWFNTSATGVKVGTFYGATSSITNRDGETVGSVSSGSKQTFSGLDIDVTAGDFFGVYAATGYIELDTSGGTNGWYSSGGDWFGTTHTYESYVAAFMVSIYGTSAASGWANIAKVNGITSASIAKVNGIAVASIAKVNGVAV
jgi:hypothetical protein